MTAEAINPGVRNTRRIPLYMSDLVAIVDDQDELTMVGSGDRHLSSRSCQVLVPFGELLTYIIYERGAGD